MLAHLPKDRYEPRDIYIDTQGQWHDRGRPTAPDKVLQQVDVVLNGLHGEYGEDGELQKLLESFGVSYTGSDLLGARFAMHKLLAKQRATEAGLLTPRFFYVERIEDAPHMAAKINRTFIPPVVIKPVGWGSSIGVSLVGGHVHILRAIEDLFAQGASGVLVEQYIRGREAAVGVIEGLRTEKLYGLPVTELIPPAGDFFSRDSRYSGKTIQNCPGNFSRVESEELRRAAKVIHRALGLRHYSRSDFIVSPRGIYYLETDALPDITRHSSLSKSLSVAGISLPEFLHHVIGLARR